MSLVPVNLASRDQSVCWVCNNQSSAFSKMIINCNCQPQGVHEDCLVESIKHIKQRKALEIKQSDEFPDFEYYTCPHCSKAVYFRPDLSYSYKRDKYTTPEKVSIFLIIFVCFFYMGMIIFITISMPEDIWVRLLIDALLLFAMLVSAWACITSLRVKFYWLFEGPQF